MVTVIPALMPKSLGELEEQLAKVWAYAPRVQLDVIDGIFSPNKTVGPELLNQIDTIVQWDVHLMVDEPEVWVKRCVMGGVDRVFGQVERMNDRTAFIADAQSEGLGVGLAYDIDTPLAGLEEVIDDLDAILLMSVKAGDQAKEFDDRVLEKIKEVRRMNKRIPIVVDGGINEEKMRECLAAEWAEEIEEEELNRSTLGIEFVVGSHLLTAGNVEAELEHLRMMKSHDSVK
jgi:ribulose-phosphate 3-epimerase